MEGSFVSVVMEVNNTVGVINDNESVGSNSYKVTCTFTAAGKNLTGDCNVFKSEVACTDTVCHNEVAVDCNILKSYTLASYNYGALLFNRCVCTFCADICLKDVMEELCKFFTGDEVTGSDCSVFITVNIAFLNHTCNSSYRPCINFISVGELVKTSSILAVNEENSCKCENNIFSLHVRVGSKCCCACAVHHAHLHCLCDRFIIPLTCFNVLEVCDICLFGSAECSCNDCRKFCSCQILAGFNLCCTCTLEKSVFYSCCQSFCGPALSREISEFCYRRLCCLTCLNSKCRHGDCLKYHHYCEQYCQKSFCS